MPNYKHSSQYCRHLKNDDSQNNLMHLKMIQATKYSNRNYLLYLEKKCRGSLYEGEKFFRKKLGRIWPTPVA